MNPASTWACSLTAPPAPFDALKPIFVQILVVGSCEAYFWADAVKFAYPDLQADILLLGGDLAETPPKDVTAYDLQIVQIKSLGAA